MMNAYGLLFLAIADFAPLVMALGLALAVLVPLFHLRT